MRAPGMILPFSPHPLFPSSPHQWPVQVRTVGLRNPLVHPNCHRYTDREIRTERRIFARCAWRNRSCRAPVAGHRASPSIRLVRARSPSLSVAGGTSMTEEEQLGLREVLEIAQTSLEEGRY